MVQLVKVLAHPIQEESATIVSSRFYKIWYLGNKKMTR